MTIGKKGQGEGLIKLLVVAIIAIIALAVAKSYFQESAKVTQKTVEEVLLDNLAMPGLAIQTTLSDLQYLSVIK